MTNEQNLPAVAGQVERRVMWRCCECHEGDIHGGVKQTSKTRGTAGRCYWCNKPVDVYFGESKKLAT